MRNIGEKFALVKYDAKLCDYYAKHSKTLLAFREIKFYLRETFAKLRENKFTVTKKKYRREDRRKDVRTFRENYAKLREIKFYLRETFAKLRINNFYLRETLRETSRKKI